MGTLRTIDAIVIIAYFVLMIVLGIVGYKRIKSSEDYYIAGKRLGTFSVASMWLTSWIGGSSIIGTSTDAYNMGISGGYYVVILSLGCVIFALTFSTLTKRIGERINSITYPELISKRYGKDAGLMVTICSFIANIGFLASQLVAMGSLLTTITGLDSFTCFLISTAITVAYSAVGGLLAITYTAWIQFILIIFGTVIIGIPISTGAIGGFSGFSQLPPEWFDPGRAGWGTTLALLFSSVFSFFTSMDSYTRCFAAKSEKASRNGAMFAGLGILFIAIGATVMGLAARILIPSIPAGSSAYAALVAAYFPAGISGLVLVGVFAAIMSTGVVCINLCSANVASDIYKGYIKPDAPDKSIRNLGMISALFIGVFGALMAWWKYNVIDLLMLAFTFQGGALFVPTICGMIWKKPGSKAGVGSMLSTFIVILVWLIADALGAGGIFALDAFWPGITVSVISFFLITALEKTTEEDAMRNKVFFGE